jgi:hypothetical protein
MLPISLRQKNITIQAKNAVQIKQIQNKMAHDLLKYINGCEKEYLVIVIISRINP